MTPLFLQMLEARNRVVFDSSERIVQEEAVRISPKHKKPPSFQTGAFDFSEWRSYPLFSVIFFSSRTRA